MSRTEIITPPSFESASKNWLAEARMVRQLPSRWRAPYSAEPKLCRARRPLRGTKPPAPENDPAISEIFLPSISSDSIAQQVVHPRAHEGVALFQIDHQDEIREAFEQLPAKFLLLQYCRSSLRLSVTSTSVPW